MSEEPPTKPPRKWSERIYAILAICLFAMFLGCSGLITALELPLRLMLGWAWHLIQAAPALLPLWPKLLLPLGCLALATWLVHRFIRWWITTKGQSLDWRPRHTVSATLLVLLGAAAAIALSGVVHQAVWLADAPWWTNRGRPVERVEAMSKIQQLHIAIIDFQGEHGRYPESLSELELKNTFQLLYQSPARGEPTEPFLYLKPRDGMVEGDEDGSIILVSPLLGPDRDRVAVGFTSGATRSLLSEQLPEILETRRMPEPKRHD